MRVDLTSVITAFIAALTAILIRYLIPWIRSKTSEQDRKDLLVWVDIAVAAAQQLYYQMSGPERKQYVLDFLEKQGFDVNDPEVDAAIEAAVLALHQSLEDSEDG